MHYMSTRVVQDSTRSLMAKAGKQGGETNVDVLKSQNQNNLDANIRKLSALLRQACIHTH